MCLDRDEGENGARDEKQNKTSPHNCSALATDCFKYEEETLNTVDESESSAGNVAPLRVSRPQAQGRDRSARFASSIMV